MASDLHQVIKKVVNQCAKKRKIKRKSPPRQFCFVTDELLSGFALAKNVNLNWLKLEARRLQLVQTVSERHTRNDRIGFGLPRAVTRDLKPCPKTLFTYERSKSTGLFRKAFQWK